MMLKVAVALVFAAVSSVSMAGEHSVAQKNKAFSVEKLEIKVGDTVHFPNEDPIHHNVFSLSEIKTFDLGSYDQGESKSVVFDKPGTIEVECAIHPSMRMTIVVSE